MAEILKKSLFPLAHYEYGEAFFGSENGMRYRIAAEPLTNFHYTPVAERDEVQLSFSAWPEPYNYASTPKEEIVTALFPFSEEGFDEGVRWLNKQADYL